MADTQLIGLDWGTTSLRAYRFVDGGALGESRQLASGILRVVAEGSGADGFERCFEEACGDWIAAAPTCSVVACGMIGSAQGWREAPYLDVPTSLDALGHALTAVQTRSGPALHIIPGLIDRAVPEVMRGEETQVAGALERTAPAGVDRWFGLPGTHSKWVRVRDHRIVQFHTFMTGELFAALCAHTILGRTMQRPPAPDLHAFDRGVEVARARTTHTVLSTIFSTRTLHLVGALPAEAQADYLSGLLISHELAALGALGVTGPIVLIGADELCRRYQRALSAFDHEPASLAADATPRGLWRVATAAGLA